MKSYSVYETLESCPGVFLGRTQEYSQKDKGGLILDWRLLVECLRVLVECLWQVLCSKTLKPLV